MHHYGAFSPENSQNSVTKRSQAVTNRYTLLQSVSSSTRPDSVRVRHFEEILMKVRIVKDKTRDEFLPAGGFTLMMQGCLGRYRAYAGWFPTKQDAAAYVAARPNMKKACETVALEDQ